MTRALAVIGAGYGDEGKGKVVDYLAAQHKASVVVRFNGGAQAGHTVQLDNGTRHVFHHLSSGTFAKSITYLSRHFVCHPMLYRRERQQLQAMGCGGPMVLVDTRSPITTPYDMFLNQLAEQARGIHRHGSCGVGFGETVERSQFPEFTIMARDLQWRDKVRETCLRIREHWVPARARALGLEAYDPAHPALSNDFLDRFLRECGAFAFDVALCLPERLSQFGTVIFEGAQGLDLDQENGAFPHVTRSHTGLRNVLDICQDAMIDHVEPFYVTRAYRTRHGAGPLRHQLPELPYAKVADPTNQPHEYQGSIRFAPLDVDALTAAVRLDHWGAKAHPVVKVDPPRLAVTCLDQLTSSAWFFFNGQRLIAHVPEDLIGVIYENGHFAGDVLASYGPERGQMRILRHRGVSGDLRRALEHARMGT